MRIKGHLDMTKKTNTLIMLSLFSCFSVAQADSFICPRFTHDPDITLQKNMLMNLNNNVYGLTMEMFPDSPADGYFQMGSDVFSFSNMTFMDIDAPTKTISHTGNCSNVPTSVPSRMLTRIYVHGNLSYNNSAHEFVVQNVYCTVSKPIVVSSGVVSCTSPAG